MGTLKRFLLLLALCHVTKEANASLIGVQKPNINLSYHTHLNLESFSSALDKEISRVLLDIIDSNEKRKRIYIDVSSSIIGDEGIISVLDTLMTCNPKNISTEYPVELDMRMNRITSSGVSSFLKRYLLYLAESDADDLELSSQNDIYLSDLRNDHKRLIYLDSIDLGVNDIGLHGIDTDSKSSMAIAEMNKMFRTLVQNEYDRCPRALRLDVCGLGPATCKAIGKGLINRKHIWPTADHSLRYLYLCGNEGIGDSGLAAIAAALKLAKRPKLTGETKSSLTILDHLDVSACHVGDIGAKALAISLQSNPGCLKNLDLSNNFITDEGAINLATGIIAGYKKNGLLQLDLLDLSNNVDIGVEGAIALFSALKCGAIRRLALRSCSIKWNGAFELGSTIASILLSDNLPDGIEIDLSGNKLGIREVKSKSNYADGVKKVTNMGMNWLKSSLKDAGFVGGVESDDEEELLDPLGTGLVDEDQKSSKCGACAMYDGLEKNLRSSNSRSTDSTLTIGFRMCNFDDKGIDALAAIARKMFKSNGCKIHIDCSMNQTDDNDKIIDKLLKGDLNDRALIARAERHVESRKFVVAREAQKKAEYHLNHAFNEETDYSQSHDTSSDEFNF